MNSCIKTIIALLFVCLDKYKLILVLYLIIDYGCRGGQIIQWYFNLVSRYNMGFEPCHYVVLLLSSSSVLLQRMQNTYRYLVQSLGFGGTFGLANKSVTPVQARNVFAYTERTFKSAFSPNIPTM